jgi:hypothetical protein
LAKANSRFSNQATWYLALARIKTNKIDLAKESLNSLIEGQSSYSEKATEVLNQL